MTPASKLTDMRACGDAAEWAQQFLDLETAWRACERGDWMLWFAGKVGVHRQDLILAACECARLALPRANTDEVRICIETAEGWARGERKIKELRDARRAARLVYFDADDAGVYSAAAAYAGSAAFGDAAAYDTACACAYGAANVAEVRKDTLRKCADIARKYWPTLPEG